MKKIVVIVCFTSMLFGCQKYIDFDAEIVKSKIVVNGLVNNNQPALVHVSRSLSVIDNGSLNRLEDATVKLYDASNGSLIEVLLPMSDSTLLIDQSGYYQGMELLNENTEYKLEVSAPTYDLVSSITKIPQYNLTQATPVDTISSQDIDYGAVTNFTFHFVDNASEVNYYGIKAYGITSDGNENEIYMNTKNISVDVNSGNEILFKDKFFNGNVYDLTLNFSTFYYGPPINDSLFFDNTHYDSIRFEMNSYSRDMYLYQISFMTYQNADNFFSQPVQVYSNIENGLGVFGGSKTDYFTMAIE